MSIRTVVTRGYKFGFIADVVRRGYGVGEDVTPEPTTRRKKTKARGSNIPRDIRRNDAPT